MHVRIDYKAKIAWVIGHEHPIASFAFGEWGGASGASVAARKYIKSDTKFTPEQVDAWNDAIEAAAQICAERQAGAAVTVGADAEGQLEGACEDIRALLKTSI